MRVCSCFKGGTVKRRPIHPVDLICFPFEARAFFQGGLGVRCSRMTSRWNGRWRHGPKEAFSGFMGDKIKRNSSVQNGGNIHGSSAAPPPHQVLVPFPCLRFDFTRKKKLITNFKNSSLLLTNFRKSYLHYFGDMCFKNKKIFNCFIPCFFMILILKPLF